MAAARWRVAVESPCFLNLDVETGEDHGPRRPTKRGHPMNLETQTVPRKYPIAKTKKFFARVSTKCGLAHARDPYPPNIGPKLRVYYNYK